jgi:translation elongation factor EF-G
MVIVNEINAGDIGAFLGLKTLRSGDTLIDEADQEEIILKGMKMPPPVFFCSIEPEEFRD